VRSKKVQFLAKKSAIIFKMNDGAFRDQRMIAAEGV
jgi:hypothetical protein